MIVRRDSTEPSHGPNESGDLYVIIDQFTFQRIIKFQTIDISSIHFPFREVWILIYEGLISESSERLSFKIEIRQN